MSKENKGAKKQVRNKGRDALMDYYKTNREITKEYDRQYSQEKAERTARGEKRAKWSKTEQMYLAVIVVGIILIGIKYIVF